MAAQPLLGVCGAETGHLQPDPKPLPRPQAPRPAAFSPGGETPARDGARSSGIGVVPPLVPPRSGPSLAWSSSGLVVKTQVG